MVDTNKTEIVVILDRSGSMASVRTDMEGGFNAFIQKQKELPGQCSVTLAQFDDVYEPVYTARDVREVPALELVPRGSTALLDAVGRTINDVGNRFRTMPEEQRPGRVLVMIITDGHENASKEYNRARIRDMIKHQTDKYQWDFMYLGANQDSFSEGISIGVSGGNTLRYHGTVKGAQDMWVAATNTTNNYRSASYSTRGMVIGNVQADYDAVSKGDQVLSVPAEDWSNLGQSIPEDWLNTTKVKPPKTPINPNKK